MKTVELGKKYIDTVTGIEGTATGRAVYSTGSPQVCLEWAGNGEQKHGWFDEARLHESPEATAAS